MNDVFVRDRLLGSTTRVSVSSTGERANSGSKSPVISGDGRYVAFESLAWNLAPGDAPWAYGSDVFVHDRATGETRCLSLNRWGLPAGASGWPSISRDGGRVAFSSWAGLLGTTPNGNFVFLWDLTSGLSLASVGPAGEQIPSSSPSLSPDGGTVAFITARMPGCSGRTQVVVRDLATGTSACASTDSAGTLANDAATSPRLASGGRLVTFQSNGSNLVPGDTNGVTDVFVKDLVSGETVRASVGAGGTQANGRSSTPAISDDGSRVTFESAATNLVAGDTVRSDVFLTELEW